MALTKIQMAKRMAQDIQKGFIVNLGIGIPTLVASFISVEKQVMLHSENGLLGIGDFPSRDNVDSNLINAGKQTITTVPGASFFSSAESFAMIRGGHIDLAILGAIQVDEKGCIANWMIPNQMVKGMGGAMDLVSGSKKTVALMTHCDKKGAPKLLKNCNFPLTGKYCIQRIVTDLAVIDIKSTGFVLRELAPGVSKKDVCNATEADLDVSGSITEMVDSI